MSSPNFALSSFSRNEHLLIYELSIDFLEKPVRFQSSLMKMYLSENPKSGAKTALAVFKNSPKMSRFKSVDIFSKNMRHFYDF